MRKSKLEVLRDKKRKEMKPVETDIDGLFKLMLNGEFNPTQREFIYSPNRIKAYMGPAGCAKTSTLAAAGLGRALFQPGSKGFVSRNDYNDLMDTTALRMQEMLLRLPKGILLDRDKSPPMKWWIRPIVEGDPSQITFVGLKDDIVGVEADWWIVDEANEVEEVRFHQINARLRNIVGKQYGFMMGLAFNPPVKHHWLYTACTGFNDADRKVSDPWMTLFKPQSKENIRNLPDGYYEALAKTMPEDQRQRFVEGEWGTTFEGKPVYREFNFGIHAKSLAFDPYLPLMRFWDFGYGHPYCGFAQFDECGRLLILREKFGTDVEIVPFIEQCKALTVQCFPGARNILDFGDPAAKQKKDTGSTLAELWRAGIQLRFRASRIDEGVRLLRMRMEKFIQGKPAFMIDKDNCTVLLAALRGGYHMDELGLKPEKDGYYDHSADALRYLAINVFHGPGEGVPIASLTDSGSNIPDSIEYDPSYDVSHRADPEDFEIGND